MRINERVEMFLQKLVEDGKFSDLESALHSFYGWTDKIKLMAKAEKIREKQLQKQILEACKNDTDFLELGDYIYYYKSGIYFNVNDLKK